MFIQEFKEISQQRSSILFVLIKNIKDYYMHKIHVVPYKWGSNRHRKNECLDVKFKNMALSRRNFIFQSKHTWSSLLIYFLQVYLNWKDARPKDTLSWLLLKNPNTESHLYDNRKNMWMISFLRPYQTQLSMKCKRWLRATIVQNIW